MINIVLHRLFISQWTGYSFILGIITGCIAYFLNIPLLFPLAFVLLTNAFDLIGYGNIQQIVSEYDPLLYGTTVPYYRIIQKLYNFTLAGLIWSITGNWIIALGCLCANFGGFQDLLYYIFGRYNLNQNYTWLKWTPLGMLIGDLNKWEFITQGIVSFGMVITALIIIIIGGIG